MPDSGSGPRIRTLAGLIRKNRFTREELARILGFTPEQLENRLALMERQGYLAREGACNPGPQHQPCNCCCLPCGSNGSGVWGYGLTEKGRRLAGSPSVIPSTVTDVPDSER